MTDEELIAAARTASRHSYSPYSNFAVGAALRFADGSVVTGTNIENASYGLALCAEAVAVSKAKIASTASVPARVTWRGGVRAWSILKWCARVWP